MNLKNKESLVILMLMVILISSGCVVDTRSDIEKAFEEVAIETINEGVKIKYKLQMLSNVKSTVSCSKGTKTCTFTCEDTNIKKIVESGTLEVWGGSTLNKNLLFEKTIVGSNGTITYTIEEETLGNKYTAKSFFETNEWFDNEYG